MDTDAKKFLKRENKRLKECNERLTEENKTLSGNCAALEETCKKLEVNLKNLHARYDSLGRKREMEVDARLQEHLKVLALERSILTMVKNQNLLDEYREKEDSKRREIEQNYKPVQGVKWDHQL